MKKKTWFWLIGLTLVMLVVCSGFMGLGLWAAGNFGNNADGKLGFGDAVAVVRVEGVIMPGEAPAPSPFGGTSEGAYSQTIIEQLKKANDNDDVKTVVLFVDSPGGSVFASDEIARQINEMGKPVIAAMGSLAASGGYFVSAPTDEIWASPHTLTCSIGVISQFPNLDGFAKEYGITFVTVKSGKFKDTGNPFRQFSEEDRALWQTLIDEAYGAFVDVVAEGRGIPEEQVRKIADGRICSGQQAQAMGLVDSLGYLPDVIERAAVLGGIEGEPRVIEYEKELSIFEALSSAVYHPSPVTELKQLLHLNAGSPMMYLYTGP